MRRRNWAAVWQVLGGVLGQGVSITEEVVEDYLRVLKSLGKVSLLLAVGLLPLPIIGSVFHWSWLNGLYLLTLGLICIAWLTAASPLIMLAQLGHQYIKPLRKMAELKAGVAFWGLLIVMYFWLIPVWNYPAAIPLVFIICAFLAIAFVRFGIVAVKPKTTVRIMLMLLILITVCFYMPASRSAATAFVGWLDRSIAGRLMSRLEPKPKLPQRIRCTIGSIETITFFDPLTGEPKAWYYAGNDGRIELFDGPGYHPQFNQRLSPITADAVNRIRAQLQADARRAAQQERQRREELQRIAAEQRLSQTQPAPDANRPAPRPKPKPIPPEDAHGHVEEREKEPLLYKERVIRPEEIR